MPVWSMSGQAIAVERMVYAGTHWTIRHAGPGASAWLNTHWRFAEGTGAWWFDTYFLVTNLSGSWTTATLTYRRANAADAAVDLNHQPTYRRANRTVIGSDVVVIPNYSRATVWPTGRLGRRTSPPR